MPRFEVVLVAGQAYIPLKKYEASPEAIHIFFSEHMPAPLP